MATRDKVTLLIRLRFPNGAKNATYFGNNNKAIYFGNKSGFIYALTTQI